MIIMFFQITLKPAGFQCQILFAYQLSLNRNSAKKKAKQAQTL
jgi:hypothetical protein